MLRGSLFLFIILCSPFYSVATPACLLLKKDVEQKKYSFKCDNDIVNIQCEGNSESICRIAVRNKLRSLNFNISGEDLASFELFSASVESRAECDKSARLCTITNNVCDSYTGAFQDILASSPLKAQPKVRCNALGLGEAGNIGNFSENLISNLDFSQEDCQKSSNESVESLASKISIFKKNIELPISSNDSFFNRCLSTDGNQKRADILKANINLYEELQKRLLEQVSSTSKLKEMVCEPQFSQLYKDKKLSMDKAICLVVENSKIGIQKLEFNCKFSEVSGDKRSFGDKVSSSREIGSINSATNITPLEQKPMPVAIESEMAKPVGLGQALAKVDQAIPGSYESGSASEGATAVGAVRHNIPDAALQAGQAIAPIYQRLSGIANNASNLVSKGSVGVIGRSSAGVGEKSVAAVRAVTRDTQVRITDTSGLGNVEVASPTLGKSTTPTAANPGELEKATVSGKAAGDQEGANLGGAKGSGIRGSLGGQGGSSSNRATAASDNEGSSVSSTSASVAYQKITKLNSGDQIKDFFLKEAQNIPDLRELIYNDETTKKMLATKGIKVVDRKGNSSGDLSSKPKYLISDNGVNFIPIAVKTKK